MRKRLIGRLKTRLAQLDKIDQKNQCGPLRARVREAIAEAEANPKAFDIAAILALIQAIIQILDLLRQRRNPTPAA